MSRLFDGLLCPGDLFLALAAVNDFIVGAFCLASCRYFVFLYGFGRFMFHYDWDLVLRIILINQFSISSCYKMKINPRSFGLPIKECCSRG